MKSFFAFACAAFFAAGAQGFANPLSLPLAGVQTAVESGGMSMAQVGEVMRENGFTIEFGEDGEADPVIYSEAAGLNFALFGFSCTGAGVCHEFLFSTYFDMEKAPPLEVINKFNEQALAGRAFLDEEGDPNLEHLFTVTSGDKDLIERNLAIWESVVLDFAEHLDANTKTGS